MCLWRGICSTYAVLLGGVLYNGRVWTDYTYMMEMKAMMKRIRPMTAKIAVMPEDAPPSAAGMGAGESRTSIGCECRQGA